MEDPQDAIQAFDALTTWVRGFRRNSRGRQEGQDYFFSARERANFEELHAMIANIRDIPELQAPPPRQSRPSQRSPGTPSRVQETPPHGSTSHLEEEEEALESSPASAKEYIPTFSFVASPVSNVSTPQRDPSDKG